MLLEDRLKICRAGQGKASEHGERKNGKRNDTTDGRVRGGTGTGHAAKRRGKPQRRGVAESGRRGRADRFGGEKKETVSASEASRRNTPVPRRDGEAPLLDCPAGAAVRDRAREHTVPPEDAKDTRKENRRSMGHNDRRSRAAGEERHAKRGIMLRRNGSLKKNKYAKQTVPKVRNSEAFGSRFYAAGWGGCEEPKMEKNDRRQAQNGRSAPALLRLKPLGKG